MGSACMPGDCPAFQRCPGCSVSPTLAVLFTPQRVAAPPRPGAHAARTSIGRVVFFARPDTIRSPHRGLSRRCTTPPGDGRPGAPRARVDLPSSPVARRPVRATRWWSSPSRFGTPPRCRRVPLLWAALGVSERQAAPGILRRMRCMRRPLLHGGVGGCEGRRAMRRGTECQATRGPTPTPHWPPSCLAGRSRPRPTEGRRLRGPQTLLASVGISLAPRTPFPPRQSDSGPPSVVAGVSPRPNPPAGSWRRPSAAVATAGGPLPRRPARGRTTTFTASSIRRPPSQRPHSRRGTIRGVETRRAAAAAARSGLHSGTPPGTDSCHAQGGTG